MSGIESISIAVPAHFVDAIELSHFRGFGELYAKEGVGVERIRICYKDDLISMAVRAASRLDLSDVDLIIVATESAKDLSKPMGVKIIKKLGLGNNVGTVEMKFACAAGAYAVMYACHRVNASDSKALVVCCDESFYPPRTHAEITSGAGAVAMILSDNGGLEIDFSKFGVYVDDVDDFYKPVWSKYPMVDGKLSQIAYLYAMKMAYQDWKEKNNFNGNIIDRFKAFVFHTPFPKMVQHAFAALYAIEVLRMDRKVHIEDLKYNPELYEEWRSERKKVMTLPEFQKTFDEKVAPSLVLPRLVGNSYTASMWIALASALTYGDICVGDEIALGSYGSGMGAMAFTGKVTDKVEVLGVDEVLSGYRLSPIEYDCLIMSKFM
ncbi:MAG: hypothetical protein DRJ47_06665 [Thermoprotei archaeon]|nr:MAG: hypothetical protein DRJ47_06665 [Thermoprotei archaeon]